MEVDSLTLVATTKSGRVLSANGRFAYSVTTHGEVSEFCDAQDAENLPRGRIQHVSIRASGAWHRMQRDLRYRK